MVHECNVFCHSAESDLMELIGNEESLDVGKWLPFAIDITLVIAIKMTSDDKQSMVHKCTTVFLSTGDIYIIDTKYKNFLNIWRNTLGEYDEPSDDIEDSFNL